MSSDAYNTIKELADALRSRITIGADTAELERRALEAAYTRALPDPLEFTHDHMYQYVRERDIQDWNELMNPREHADEAEPVERVPAFDVW